MAKRRQLRRVSKEGIRFGTRGTRIIIPQPPDRPIIVREKDVVRRDVIQEDPPWFTLHRRGPERPVVGEDPLERRAVSESKVRGFLSERIVYKWLLGAKMRPGSDFDFQSSMLGGRLELGGMVVDYIFPRLMIALRIQGPTHLNVMRMRKDHEQRQILESMGYKVYDLDLPTILNEIEFNNFMRNMLFNERQGGTTVMEMQTTQADEGDEQKLWDWADEKLGELVWQT
jgi:hypothetical protein